MRTIEKPRDGEFAPYAIMYIGLLPDDGAVLDHMRESLRTTTELVRAIPAARHAVPYAEGKWTVKEVVAHVIDDERIYAYRALRFARNDATELPGFDQDHFARYSGANARDMESLLSELAEVRAATISLFESFDDEMLLRSGVADGNRMTVRAAAYHIAGHELHHANGLRTNYA